LFAAFPDYTAEVEELRDLGDLMLVRVRGSAQSAHGDTLMLDRFWQVGRWRDGTCLWWCNYSSEAEALEAVGLRELAMSPRRLRSALAIRGA
jgi:hypothetical protein